MFAYIFLNGYWVCNFDIWNSGGTAEPEEVTEGGNSHLPKQEVFVEAPADRDNRIQAARDRFLARKANK